MLFGSKIIFFLLHQSFSIFQNLATLGDFCILEMFYDLHEKNLKIECAIGQKALVLNILNQTVYEAF